MFGYLSWRPEGRPRIALEPVRIGGVTFLVLDVLLTGSAMLRYNVRRAAPEPQSSYDEFIDMQYPDSRIEARWPNMIAAGGEPS